MKTILTAFTIFLSLFAYSQRQEGQTCLFTCLNHIDSRKSVSDYIHDYSLFTHTRRDVYLNGAKGSTEEIASFIRSEFDTIDLRKCSIISAIDSGYAVIALVRPGHSWCQNVQHVITIQGYYSTDPKNPTITELIFYDPDTGNSKERITLEDFLVHWQLYCVAVRAARPMNSLPSQNDNR